MSAIEPDDGWYERMAQRAKARQLIAETEAHLVRYGRLRQLLPADDGWLRGWALASDLTVDLGPMVACAGCGACLEVSSWIPSGVPAEPTWPFPQDACPVCREGDGEFELGRVGPGGGLGEPIARTGSNRYALELSEPTHVDLPPCPICGAPVVSASWPGLPDEPDAVGTLQSCGHRVSGQPAEPYWRGFFSRG